MSEYSSRCMDLRTDEVLISADEHAQTSGAELGDRHSPRPAGAQTAQKQHAGVARAGHAAIRRQHPSSRGAQHRRSLPAAQGAASSYPDTYAASGPGPGTWKDPDPRRRSNRGSGAQIGLRARQDRLRDACGLSRLNASWRYGLRRTRRLVAGRSPRPRSAWSDQARLAFLAVTHRYTRTPCLWLEQFQIAE
jgi:hypothetical protein